MKFAQCSMRDLKLKRKKCSHKGDNGRVLVAGGSKKFHGAPILCAMAALRAGCDMVTVATTDNVKKAIEKGYPDLIAVPFSEIEETLERQDVVVAGPGLGVGEKAGKLVRTVLSIAEIPIVIDADALKISRNFPALLKSKNTILTPHPGEFESLFSEKLDENFSKKAEQVRLKAKLHSSVIILKGKEDIITDGVRIKINKTGNEGMTVGGTGDVLAGLTGSFISQGMTPFDAGCAAAYVNGKTGDFLFRKKKYGFTASDFLELIPEFVFRKR